MMVKELSWLLSNLVTWRETFLSQYMNEVYQIVVKMKQKENKKKIITIKSIMAGQKVSNNNSYHPGTCRTEANTLNAKARCIKSPSKVRVLKQKTLTLATSVARKNKNKKVKVIFFVAIIENEIIATTTKDNGDTMGSVASHWVCPRTGHC